MINKKIGRRYAKRSLMAWVGVISKEGWARGRVLLLVWHQLVTFFFFLKKQNFELKFFFFFFEKVSVIPKEGWAQPCVPILLLVWQRLRPLRASIINKSAQKEALSYQKKDCMTDTSQQCQRGEIKLFDSSTTKFALKGNLAVTFLSKCSHYSP